MTMTESSFVDAGVFSSAHANAVVFKLRCDHFPIETGPSCLHLPWRCSVRLAAAKIETGPKVCCCIIEPPFQHEVEAQDDNFQRVVLSMQEDIFCRCEQRSFQTEMLLATVFWACDPCCL